MNANVRRQSGDSLVGSLPNHIASFEEFARNIIALELSPQETAEILQYAEVLSVAGLPILLDASWVGQMIGYETKIVLGMATSQRSFYRTYEARKRSGGTRIIDEPLPSLKRAQQVILNEILSKLPVHKAAHAYRKNHTIRKNARIHLRQNSILKIDIKDFFGSIRAADVRNVFYSLGYTNGVSTTLTNLCLLDGRLPQGAPTSPALSNLVMRKFDEDMLDHFSKNGKRYTRYSDDMVVSGEKMDASDIKYIRERLHGMNLRVNYKKTKIFGPGTAKIVTGLLVGNKLRASTTLRDNIRSEIYFIERYGLLGHANRKRQSAEQCLRRLEGQVNFVLWIDPKDKNAAAQKERLAEVRSEYVSVFEAK